MMIQLGVGQSQPLALGLGLVEWVFGLVVILSLGVI